MFLIARGRVKDVVSPLKRCSIRLGPVCSFFLIRLFKVNSDSSRVPFLINRF